MKRRPDIENNKTRVIKITRYLNIVLFQVLGNHEFDNGIEGVVPYLEHLDSKVVTANIIDDLEPTIQGLYYPSIVVVREGRRIGIIGVIISTTNVRKRFYP